MFGYVCVSVWSFIAGSSAHPVLEKSRCAPINLLHLEPDLRDAVGHVRDIANEAYVIAQTIIEVMGLHERQQWNDLRTRGNSLKRSIHRHVVHEVFG